MRLRERLGPDGASQSVMEGHLGVKVFEQTRSLLDNIWSLGRRLSIVPLSWNGSMLASSRKTMNRVGTPDVM